MPMGCRFNIGILFLAAKFRRGCSGSAAWITNFVRFGKSEYANQRLPTRLPIAIYAANAFISWEIENQGCRQELRLTISDIFYFHAHIVSEKREDEMRTRMQGESTDESYDGDVEKGILSDITKENTQEEEPIVDDKGRTAEYYYKESFNNRKYGLYEAIDLLIKASELGHPEADYRIAQFIDHPKFSISSPQPFEDMMYYLDRAISNNHLGALDLRGEIYLTGVWAEYYYEGNHEMLIEADYRKAMKDFIAAAKQGYAPSQYRLYKIYEEGTITPLNYQKSFEWLKKAAYNRHIDAYPDLVRAYESGIFANLEEAYIWSLIAKASKAFLTDKHAPLRIEKTINNPKKIMELQREANRRANIMNERALTDEDVIVSSPSVEADKKAATQTEVPQRHIASTESEETIELSDGKQYKYANTIKKGFDPSKIKLTLIVKNILGKNDEVDFDEVKISYNNQNHDRKKVDIYTAAPVKLNKKARILLIRLALQFEIKDQEMSNTNIAKILKDPLLSGDVVSAVNSLAKSMFPGCFEKRSPFINKGTGELKISLSIDKWMIEQAMDFKEVAVIK